ncbi:huntingtin-interacting protein K [Hydra vulgaris]|nr:huntingtin-interacting protein K [Hydra vulgaris]
MSNPVAEPDLVNGENEPSEDEEQNEKKKKHEKAACADLEKITDYEEDKEIDEQNISNAITLLEGRRSEENTKKAAREKELAQVKVRKEDIELITNEMEVSQSIAEQKLRETGGDVVQALVLLTN